MKKFLWDRSLPPNYFQITKICILQLRKKSTGYSLMENSSKRYTLSRTQGPRLQLFGIKYHNKTIKGINRIFRPEVVSDNG